MNLRTTQGEYSQSRASRRTTKDMTTRTMTTSSTSMTGWGLKRDTSPLMSCSALNPPEQFYYLRYLILDVLGQGTFGQVVKCQDMKTHEIVAVKVVKNKPAYFNQSMMEVTILELVCLYFGSSFVSIDRGFIAQQSVRSSRRTPHPPFAGLLHPPQSSLSCL